MINRFDIDPEKYVEAKTIELLRRRVAARGAITPQVLHDAEFKMHVDYVTDRLWIQLESHVLAERIDHEDQTVTFYRTVTPPPIDVLRLKRRGMKVPLIIAFWPIVCAILAALFIGTTTYTAIVIGAVFAALAIAWARPVSELVSVQPPDVTVSGEVTIGADYWHTFPRNETVYPKSLGGAVRLLEYTPPDFRFFDPETGADR